MGRGLAVAGSSSALVWVLVERVPVVEPGEVVVVEEPYVDVPVVPVVVGLVVPYVDVPLVVVEADPVVAVSGDGF